ncbi:MAG: tryptophan synthase subunit beta, partial [Spirochaetota bacterium]
MATDTATVRRGYFGEYGGMYIPETLTTAILQLEDAYENFKNDESAQQELSALLSDYAGRPTKLYLARRFSDTIGVRVYLKREDLMHTGAHKLNNTLGQILLARYMNKKRIIAETGAGQHGVATATVCALMGMECVVYMGELDCRRQETNVKRMQLLGATVVPVTSGSKTLKDAVNAAMRDWVKSYPDTHYLVGSVMGPHPFPTIVRDFQKIIGEEAISQFAGKEDGRLPDAVIACVGGGSNAAGIFYPFSGTDVPLIGVEAGGISEKPGENCATLTQGSPGIFQGGRSYLIQDSEGQVLPVHSISAGLDYPSVGPEHAFWKDAGRVRYVTCSDRDALSACFELSRTEGILPALESSHALGYLMKNSDL